MPPLLDPDLGKLANWQIGKFIGSYGFGQGSMAVWKNDTKLGVIQAEGLGGEYCWAVEMSDEGSSSRMCTWIIHTILTYLKMLMAVRV